jgi:hypothetical protein
MTYDLTLAKTVQFPIQVLCTSLLTVVEYANSHIKEPVSEKDFPLNSLDIQPYMPCKSRNAKEVGLEVIRYRLLLYTTSTYYIIMIVCQSLGGYTYRSRWNCGHYVESGSG